MKQSQQITCRQILVSLLLFVGLLEFTFEVCPIGFYGKDCHYSCRCQSLNCYEDGNCLSNVSCFEEYFGPECQYINMVNRTPQANDWVHDNNDSNCSPFRHPVDIRVKLVETTFMTWFRIHYRYPHRLGDANQAIDAKINGTVSCLHKRVYLFRTGIVDVSCDNIVLMSSLVISGRITTMLCNIFVSGGRNVVYRHNATIVGVGRNFTSERPVDDNFYCQVAFPEVAKQVIIDVPNPHLLYRILIVTPNGTTSIHNFFVQMYSGSNVTVSRDVRGSADYKHTIFMYDWTPFTRLSITITPEVEICEVQATGETWCELTSYGFDCEHPCQCQPNEICFPPTGMCGPECPSGSYGFMCSLKCGRGCLNSRCDYRRGNCSCGPGFIVDGVCNRECPEGTYGIDCVGTCSGNCEGDRNCDRASGNCIGCMDGYFGSGCHFQCSSRCLTRRCDKETGECDSCAKGHFGGDCSGECPKDCFSSECNFTTGSCIQCKTSRFGVRSCQPSECEGHVLVCNKTCSTNCKNSLCDDINGKCFACKSGLKGSYCEENDRVFLVVLLLVLMFLILVTVSILIWWLLKRKSLGRAAVTEPPQPKTIEKKVESEPEPEEEEEEEAEAEEESVDEAESETSTYSSSVDL